MIRGKLKASAYSSNYRILLSTKQFNQQLSKNGSVSLFYKKKMCYLQHTLQKATPVAIHNANEIQKQDSL